MRFLYTTFIRLYRTGIMIASLWNKKARLWIKGRKNWKTELLIDQDRKVIWFHCSSLGEFEQGLPVMKAMKNQSTDNFILLSFFSPSGYEIRKNTDVADKVVYLPPDTVGNAESFINMVRPEMAFFVKYDFWFNYLNILRQKNVPTYLISGLFRKDQYFFKPWGWWFRSHFKAFKYFFVQDESSKKIMENAGFNNCMVSGDTRFDRVREILKNPAKFEIFENNTDPRPCFVVGSNWPKDDELLIPFINNHISDYKVIIAPHNIELEQVKNLVSGIKGVVLRFSEINMNEVPDWDVIVIDSIGKLSSLYQYGKIAYIGGGFGKSVHNTLEAATYGLPTVFGPNYYKFRECRDLVKSEGAFSINTLSELEDTMQKLGNQNYYDQSSQTASTYIEQNTGATEKIVNSLKIIK